jgi:hypothetical protein
MRIPFLTTLALIISTVSFAQRNYKTEQSCPKLYIGLSTGLENQSGLIGFNMDAPITGKFSLGAGAGLSSWGYKAYGEGRFYFGECNKGWALGAGVTYNTGLKNFTSTMPTTMGDRDVLMNLNPATNVFLAGYRFWNMGRRGHRIYLEVGYSYRLQEDNYAILSYHTLTSDGKQVMKILQPGGLIVAFGFSFGVAR